MKLIASPETGTFVPIDPPNPILFHSHIQLGLSFVSGPGILRAYRYSNHHISSQQNQFVSHSNCSNIIQKNSNPVLLYIGSQESAHPAHLASLLITHVVRLGSGPWSHPNCIGVEYYDVYHHPHHQNTNSSNSSNYNQYVGDEDKVTYDRLVPNLRIVLKIIDKVHALGQAWETSAPSSRPLKPPSVLVLCEAGVNKSAAVVIACLMKRGGYIVGYGGGENRGGRVTESGTCKKSLRDAFEIVHAARPVICPSPRLWRDLEAVERSVALEKMNEPELCVEPAAAAATITNFSTPSSLS